MKKIIIGSFVAFCVAAMVSCGTDTNKIDYIPVRVEKGEGWGFVDKKGKVTLQDEFSECPSMVREGIFSVRDKNGYSLYEYDAKKPKLIMEDLASVGSPRNGLLPICRKDRKIEIITTSGKTKFELAGNVLGCSPFFEHGYLVVTTVDSDNHRKCALVNESGRMVLKPKYDFIKILTNQLFLVSDGEEYMMINAKGEKQKQWKDDVIRSIDYIDQRESAEYVVIADRERERLVIYNLKGEEVFKCPAKVQRIMAFNDNKFVFRNEDHDYGVMNIKGEQLISPKYEAISMIDKGYLVSKEGRKGCEVLDEDGDSDGKIDDFDYIIMIDGFGAIGTDGDDCYVLNSKFAPVHKDAYYRLETDIDDGYSSWIESDYFDYADVVSKMLNAAQQGLSDKGLKFGVPLKNISYLVNKGTSAFSNYRYREILFETNKMDLKMEIEFIGRALKTVYRTQRVRKQGWYSYYYTDEQVYDHTEFSDTKIEYIKITAEVPYSKTDELYKRLKETLSGKYQGENSTYIVEDKLFTISANSDEVVLRIDKNTQDSNSDEVVEEVVVEEVE